MTGKIADTTLEPEVGTEQRPSISKVKAALEKRKAAEVDGAEKEEQKSFGIIRVTLYKEGAYRVGKDGEKHLIGGDNNGNYDRICSNLDIPDNDPDLLADILDVLSGDIKEGKLRYADEPAAEKPVEKKTEKKAPVKINNS